MVDLPCDRVTPNKPPFSSVGIDYFGPFEINKDGVESSDMDAYSPV